MAKKSSGLTLAVCCGAHALHDGLTDLLYVLLPVLAQSFGLSYSQVGLIRSASRGAMALLQVPAGLLSERLGERNLISFGTACAGISYIWLGSASSYLIILISLFFAGAGAAFQHPLASSIISGNYPEAGRRMALGTYNFSGDVGKVAIAGATSLMLAGGIGWQTPTTAYGILALICAAVLLLLLRNTGAGEKPRQALARMNCGGIGGWGIRNRRGFAALCLVEIIDNSTRSGFLTFVAFLMLARGVPEGWAVVSVPLVAVGGMAGKLACGYLAERVGVVRTVVITEAATGVGIALSLILPPFAAYFMLPFIGVALNGTSSALYGTIGDLVEPERLSRAFGLFYTLGSICGIVAPLAYGALADRVGIRGMIAVVSIVVTATLPLCMLLNQALDRTGQHLSRSANT